MLHKIPEFDRYYVAYLKDDPAKEPIAASYSAPGVLAEAARKTERVKADLNFRRSARRNTSGSNRFFKQPKKRYVTSSWIMIIADMRWLRSGVGRLRRDRVIVAVCDILPADHDRI
jgi:hypothetical protein